MIDTLPIIALIIINTISLFSNDNDSIYIYMYTYIYIHSSDLPYYLIPIISYITIYIHKILYNYHEVSIYYIYIQISIVNVVQR